MNARTKEAVLAEEFLPLRAKILELAAGLDRIERAAGQGAGDERHDRLEQGIRLLVDGEGERAQRVQLLFSRGYDQAWRVELGV